jgi:hypothetical protein
VISVTEHACPRCGRMTSGTISEGGLRWAICDDCMDAQRRPLPSEPEAAVLSGAASGDGEIERAEWDRDNVPERHEDD